MLKEILAQFDYRLPKELIALEPACPRDSAKILVFDRKKGLAEFDCFRNLGNYLPQGAVLVFNQTKVVPARLPATKPTGGRTNLLYTGHNKRQIEVLADKPLVPGSTITVCNGRYKMLSLKVAGKNGQFYILEPSFRIPLLPKILRHYGLTPLPPYLKNSQLSEKQRRIKYQSVFAREGESVAAPTASLHFTPRLMRSLKQQGAGEAFVRLDVNLGTFAPLRDDQLENNRLHSEPYSIPGPTAAFLNRAKQQKRPIIAVGTTVARALESAAEPNRLIRISGNTDLFIREDYQFKFVDGLITNFHVPKSSLLMLVSALVGREKLLSLYQEAINRKMKFFSFGDGMLIL